MSAIPNCPECGQPMTDVNEGYYRLRFGEPAWECHNLDCDVCTIKPKPVVPYAADSNESGQEQVPCKFCRTYEVRFSQPICIDWLINAIRKALESSQQRTATPHEHLEAEVDYICAGCGELVRCRR